MKLEKNRTFEESEIRTLVWLVQKKQNLYAYKKIGELLEVWMRAVSYKISLKFPKIALKLNDIILCKDISLKNSCIMFDFRREIPFSQFAIQRLKWFLYSELRSYANNKFKILNFSFNYDENEVVGQAISAKRSKNYFWVNQELQNRYYLRIFDKLESKIFKLKIEGYKNQEIAEKLKVNYKKIDNNIQKIKKKIRASFLL